MTKQKLPDPFSMIQALVECPSISSTDSRLDQSNLEVIHRLANWLETLGFDIKIKRVSDGKANLIASLGNAKDENGLVLSGHTDTVPLDENQWSFDPFKATVKDQRLYGLGTTDMKSFFALALDAASHYRAKDLNRPLIILATADEESTMKGAKMLVEDGVKLGRYAIIGEPTNLHPIRMHKGVMMESIKISGYSGHSSDPSIGASALEGMQAVLTELLAWRQDLQTRYQNPCFKVDVPTLNLGSIHGGDNPNRICSQCELQFDIRPLPGMAFDELRQSLQTQLQGVTRSNPRLSLTIDPLFDGVPAFETAAESDIVKTCETYTGHKAEAVCFGTEAPFFSKLGMETIVLGPGSIDQAHQPDEFLSVDQIQPGISLLRKLIERYCIAESPIA